MQKLEEHFHQICIFLSILLQCLIDYHQYIWFKNIYLSSSRFLCCPTAFFNLLQPWDVRELYIRKTADLPSNSGSAHFHISWLFYFIFYQKPLYKSLHQSFFYSFITILPSDSGVTLHYSTILPQILLFRHLTSIFESTHVISRY